MFYPTDKLAPYDLEVYPNYFLMGALWDDRVIQMEDPDQIERFLAHIKEKDYQLLGFNSQSYDDVVLHHFLRERTPKAAYEMSCAIIEGNFKRWNLQQECSIDSVDLMPILPGRKSLKQLGVILGHHKLQELPINPHQPLTLEQIEIIKTYNVNDLEITEKVLAKLQPELDLRGTLSAKYGVDLRSKGEANIAETVLLSEAGLRKYDMKQLAREAVQTQPWFTIRPPSWWGQLKELVKLYPSLQIVRDVGREISEKKVHLWEGQLPAKVFEKTVYLGDRYYKMGIGGLHSVDGAGCWRPDDTQALVDWDVASYYPSIILTERLEPATWGGKFLPAYQGIVERRLKAKASGDKVTADVLKIVANGSFGKFGDQYSALYCPEMLAHVTLYGQLGLLTLIAMLTDTGHRVVSANTDGVTVLSHGDDDNGPLHQWQQLTGMVLEDTPYQALYQQNVNNYCAVKEDGTLKTKGRLTPGVDLRHMPKAPIVSKAVTEFLAGRTTSLGKTITAETDINQFLLAAKVANGWKTYWGDQPLGKIVRFYKSTQADLPPIIREPVSEGVKGNKGIVVDSENGIPVDDLPGRLPSDIDYDWYIARAREMLNEIMQPKMVGMNAYAEQLSQQGLQPCIVKRNGERLSRAKAEYGTFDFDSIPEGHYMAVRTGGSWLAKIVNGVTECLIKVDKPYPAKTRPKIEKDYGHQLIYGGSVEVPVTGIVGGGNSDMDHFYTEAELKRVRK